MYEAYEFRDLSGITALATVAVGFYMLADFVMTTAVLTLAPSAPDEFGMIEFLSIGAVFVSLVTIAIVGRWIYRASVNAHAMTDEMSITPGWAVGWYFVPFANLVKPFQAMKEIWLASHRQGSGDDVRGSAILGWWWGLWLLSNLLGNITFRMEMAEGTDPQSLATAYFVSTAINIPLCIVLILIMRKIGTAQRGGIYEEVFA